MRLIEASILGATENVICHQVNCQGVMGSGLARQIYMVYPQVKEGYIAYCSKVANNQDLLGDVLYTPIREHKYVANIFGQFDYNRRWESVGACYTNYVALREGLRKVANHCKFKGYSVAIPYKLGCGLAGGDWGVVSRIIEEEMQGIPVTIYKFNG